MKLLLRITCLFLITVIPLLACKPRENNLLIFAPASMKEALVPLGTDFAERTSINVEFSFGGSMTLARQIDLGAPADILITAGLYPIEFLQTKGVIEDDTLTPITTNSLVVVVPTGRTVSAADIKSLFQISERPVIADPKLSPAGSYAKQTLQHLGAWDSLQNRLVLAADVRNAIAYVESGSADLGLVYYTDALNSEKVRQIFVVNAEYHDPIIYPGAIITNTVSKDHGKQFLKYILSSNSKAKLSSLGFGISLSVD
jgi:molybdate transport system substrate-binding protein